MHRTDRDYLCWDDMIMLFARFVKEQRLSITSSLEQSISEIEADLAEVAAVKCTRIIASSLVCRAHVWRLLCCVPERL